MNLDSVRRRTLVPAVLLACAALVAGGCGKKQGGEDGAATTAAATTTTTAQPTTATTPREPDPGDLVAVALSTLLVPGDAPDGWTASGTEDLGRPVLERCVPPSTGVTATAPYFTEGDGLALVQTVQLFTGERRARETVAALWTPSGRDCIASWLGDQIAGGRSPHVPADEDVTWGKPELGHLAPLPIGDDGAGVRVCVTEETTLAARNRLCIELSMYRVGAAVTTVLVTADSDDIPRQPVDALVTTAVERLADVDAATHPEAPSAGGGAVERARSVAPRLTDLPAGWREADSGSVRTDEPFAVTAGCRLPDDPAEALVWSPHLIEGTGRRSMSLTVAVMRRERAARALFAALGRADVRDCIARDLHEQMRTEEYEPDDVGALRTSVFEPPAVGVDAAGQRMTIEVLDNGLTVVLVTDGIVLRSGRAVAVVWQRTERSPSEQPLTRELLASIAERLRAAGR